MAQSADHAKLTNIVLGLTNYIESNPIEPGNKNNKFRYKHIQLLELYDDILQDRDPLELLYKFFTPNNLFEILSDIKLERNKIDCFTARNVYNLIEKVYIRSWVVGIMNTGHPENYKLMALGASTIRAVMRVVIRELITTKSGEHSVLTGIVDTIGDCKSENAYARDAEKYDDATCKKNNDSYVNDRDVFLDSYNPRIHNCPDITGLLTKNGLTMNSQDNDSKWIRVLESAIGTSKYHNVAARLTGTVVRDTGSTGFIDSPTITSPKKNYSKGKSKGRKIISRLKKGKGGRKTIKHKHNKNKNSRKYK